MLSPTKRDFQEIRSWWYGRTLEEIAEIGGGQRDVETEMCDHQINFLKSSTRLME